MDVLEKLHADMIDFVKDYAEGNRHERLLEMESRLRGSHGIRLR